MRNHWTAKALVAALMLAFAVPAQAQFGPAGPPIVGVIKVQKEEPHPPPLLTVESPTRTILILAAGYGPS